MSQISIIFLTTLAFLGYSRIAYFTSRYLPRYHEAYELNKIKASVRTNESVLTNDNYISQFANRRIVIPVERNLFEISTFDHIILPKITNKARIAGKLKPIKGTQLEKHIYRILDEAKKKGITCSESNPYVIHCKKNSALLLP